MYARLGKILVYLLNGKVDMWEGKPRREDKDIYMCMLYQRDPSIFI